MEELLRTLISPLVEHPEAIQIEEADGERGVTLSLRVHPDDMGRIIGKGGKRAQALRSIMKAKGNSLGERIFVDILDE